MQRKGPGLEEQEQEESPLDVSVLKFIQAVREETELPCTYKEGYEAVVMAIKANEALLGGGRVEIDPSLFEI